MSGIFLLVGGITLFIGYIQQRKAELLNKETNSMNIALIGFITQIVGIILVSLMLTTINTTINGIINLIRGSGLSSYSVNPDLGLFLSSVGILLGLGAYIILLITRRHHLTQQA